MMKTIKSLKSNLKRLRAKNAGLTFEKNSELRTLNSELVLQKGFTLIEIIILIVMAGILLPVIIVPFVTGVKSSGKPEMATKAMYLAHQRMEELMKFNYSKTPELDPTPGFPGFTPFSTGDPNYLGEYQIVYANSSDFSPSVTVVNYKRIIVRVRDPQNDTYEIYSVVTRFP